MTKELPQVGRKSKYRLADMEVGDKKDFGLHSKKLANLLSSACQYHRETKNPNAVFHQGAEFINGNWKMMLYRGEDK